MNQKLTPLRLERLLLTACGDMRGGMDASDLSDQYCDELGKQFKAQGMSDEDIEQKLTDPDHCPGKYFYVPPRARWNEPWEEGVVKDGKKEIVKHPGLIQLRLAENWNGILPPVSGGGSIPLINIDGLGGKKK